MTITKKVSKLLLFSFGLIEILLNCKTVNAATNADSSTEVVANYELSSIPADTLKEMKEIAKEDSLVDFIQKGNTVTVEILFPNDKDIRKDGTTVKTPFTTSFIRLPSQPKPKVIDFKSWIGSMDKDNGQSSVRLGTMFIAVPSSGGGYSGQNNGDRVKTGAHVHCNRFNGPNSDHRYWKKTDPRSWTDFYRSDCYYHWSKYGCSDLGTMTKCDGLDRRGKGVKDCSSWSGGPKHKNWPKTCWYR